MQPEPLKNEDVAKKLEALAYSIAKKEADKVKKLIANNRSGILRERSIRSR